MVMGSAEDMWPIMKVCTKSSKVNLLSHVLEKKHPLFASFQISSAVHSNNTQGAPSGQTNGL